MLKHTDFRKLLILLLLATPAWAGIVEDVRAALAQNSFSAAEASLNSYRAKNGVTPEYIEAYSWMGRTALSAHDYDHAAAYAKQTKDLALEQLKQHPLDSEPHLPLALGAAIEVQSQTLAARGQRTQAVAVLQNALHAYGSTSIRARLQKNLNLLSLEGKPAPALRAEQFLGSKPPILAQLKGSPVLLFFWAHWCSDCKAEIAIMAKLEQTYGPRGLVVVAPTQHYGYAAGGAEASPAAETQYARFVYAQYYASLGPVEVPLSAANFVNYGVSTTPTLALVDAHGIVRLYHPGNLDYDSLAARIGPLLH